MKGRTMLVNIYKTRIQSILQEEEFSDIIMKISEQVCSDISSDIANHIVKKDITDEELREEIRLYFSGHLGSKTELNRENINGDSSESDNTEQFMVYNEQIDDFQKIFNQLRLPKEKKDALLDSVVAITNYSAYNLMLLRTLSNAIFDTIDTETANLIVQKALFGVSDETMLMMKEINDSSSDEKIKVVNGNTNKGCKIIPFDISKIKE